MQTARIAAALFCIVAACGTSQTSGDAGNSADGGVCCPIVGEPLPCGCAKGGGWAESLDKCPTSGICDGAHTSKDTQGCDVLVADNSFCCLCAPDSGADAKQLADVTTE